MKELGRSASLLWDKGIDPPPPNPPRARSRPEIHDKMLTSDQRRGLILFLRHFQKWLQHVFLFFFWWRTVSVVGDGGSIGFDALCGLMVSCDSYFDFWSLYDLILCGLTMACDISIAARMWA